jgi:hypothetical protein
MSNELYKLTPFIESFYCRKGFDKQFARPLKGLSRVVAEDSLAEEINTSKICLHGY